MLAIKFSVLALVIAAILDVVTANDGSNPSGLLELPQGKTCTDIPNAECDKYAECEYDEGKL